MKRYIILAAVLASVLSAGFCWKGGPIGYNLESSVKDLTTWTQKNIARDPVGYVSSAISASDDIAMELKTAQVGIRQQLAMTQRRIGKNAEELEAVKALLGEFRTAYQEATADNTWPKRVRDVNYSEVALRSQITGLARRFEACQRESKQLPDFENRLSSYASQVETKLYETQNSKSDFARQLEIVRMNKAIGDLAGLVAQVNVLADTAVFIKSRDSIPTIDQLVTERAAEGTTSDFNQILTMPLN